MTTPNIEELIKTLTQTNQFHESADICTSDVITVLQSQAERIAELEAQLADQTAAYWKAHKQVQQLTADHSNVTAMGLDIAKHRDTLRAQLAAIAATEPSMIYHGRCVIDCGDSGHQDVTMLKMIARETKLFTRPMPARDAEIAAIKSALRTTIRTYVVDDDAWDTERETERFMKRAIDAAIEGAK